MTSGGNRKPAKAERATESKIDGEWTGVGERPAPIFTPAGRNQRDIRDTVALSDRPVRLPPLPPQIRQIEGTIERFGSFLPPSYDGEPPLWLVLVPLAGPMQQCRCERAAPVPSSTESDEWPEEDQRQVDTWPQRGQHLGDCRVAHSRLHPHLAAAVGDPVSPEHHHAQLDPGARPSEAISTSRARTRRRRSSVGERAGGVDPPPRRMADR
jgi:hypothetical protein